MNDRFWGKRTLTTTPFHPEPLPRQPSSFPQTGTLALGKAAQAEIISKASLDQTDNQEADTCDRSRKQRVGKLRTNVINVVRCRRHGRQDRGVADR